MSGGRLKDVAIRGVVFVMTGESFENVAQVTAVTMPGFV